MKHYVLLLIISNSLFGMGQKQPLEIELKFKLPNHLSEQFKQKLVQNISHQLHMKETYFMGKKLQPIEMNGYKKMTQYLRLRETDTGSFLTVKKRINGTVIEYETRVENVAMMRNILQALGYGTTEHTRVHLKKKRTLYNVHFENHHIEVVFDTFSYPKHMHDMGKFIEVELKSKAASHEDGILILKRFLLSHGITSIDKYPPYIELVINHNHTEHQNYLDISSL